MFCAISGEVPVQPVVSTKTGHIFEQRLIQKHLQTSHKCPITNEDLSEKDLIPVQANKAVKPRPPSATSVPGIMQLFQNEWDALVLETAALKKHVETVRQELAHALYQHDAACRVIARLRKENQSLRSALTDTKSNLSSAVKSSGMDVEKSSLLGMTEDVLSHLTNTAKNLSTARKSRAKNVPAELTPASQLSEFKSLSSLSTHKSSSKPGVTCVDIHADQVHVATGGVDGTVSIFNRATGKIEQSLEGHSKKITNVKFHPSESTILTASSDGHAFVWTKDDIAKKYNVAHIVSHKNEITGLSFHPTGSYFVTASLDKTWAFHDVASGATRVVVPADETTSPYTTISFHPDGLLVGTGSSNGVIKVWDVQTQKNVANFDHSSGAAITAIAFSENGYYCASSDESGIVKLWDLRKLKNFRTLTAEESGASQGSAVYALDFDYSGQYLAIGSSTGTVNILGTKEWNVIKSLHDHTSAVTGIKFGMHASFLASTSMDRSLRFSGPSSAAVTPSADVEMDE